MPKIPASNTGPINKSSYTERDVPLIDRNRASNTEGLNNTYLIEANPLYNRAEQEKVIESKNNTFIILGRDRLDTEPRGYGAKGNTHCGTIDIVAGLSGMLAREVDPQTKESVFTNKSVMLDAARIYISQRTDVDQNFKLAEGQVGSPKTRSAIALKADGIRLVARNGIKLITGTDTYNSQGVRIDVLSGIDLIAGNDDTDLQPLVKGASLALCLDDIVEHVSDLSSLVSKIIKHMLQIESALATHTHISPPLTGGPSSPPPLLASAIVTGFPDLAKMMADILVFEKNAIMLKMNNLQPFGENYINSQFNNTN